MSLLGKATSTELSSLRRRSVDELLAEIQHNRGCIATETNEPDLH